MKSIILLGVYLLSFVSIYMMLSLVGLAFSEASYLDILRDDPWNFIYCTCFGWWLAIFPAREYYLIHNDHFERVFN